MDMKIFKLILMIMILTITTPAAALDASILPNGFSIQQANQNLDNIEKQLKDKSTIDKDLYNSVQSLKEMQGEAKECADYAQDQLKKIDDLLSDKNLGAAIKGNSPEFQYLTQQKTEVSRIAASCRVFLFKSEQILSGYSDAFKQHTPIKKPIKSVPIWDVVSEDLMDQFSVSPEKFYQESGISKLTSNNLYGLLSLLIISLIIAKFIYSFYGNILTKSNEERYLTNHAVRIVRRYIYILLPLSVITIFLHTLFYSITPVPTIVQFCNGLLAYIGSITVVNFVLFMPVKNSENKFEHNIQRNVATVLFFRYLILSTLILLGYFGAILLKGQELTQEFVNITRTSYVTLLIFAVFWFIWVIFRIKFFADRKKSFITLFTKIIIFVALFSLITSEWLGYHDTSVFVLKGVILSSLYLMLSWGVVRLVDRIFNVLEDDRYHFSRMLRHVTDLKPHKSYFEFYMLRLAFYIIYLSFSLVVLMQIWGASLYQVGMVRSGILTGFPLLGIEIIPMQIVAGLITFSAIYLVGRVYSASITRNSQTYIERQSQVEIASIFTYIFFTVALLVGLLVAGVNFTGLAIIAGALSVGIGFGLQNIVNNFLSGLILLIQKPVKTGDRVSVAGTEGFIRKIRVLSTQIKTLSREDVIIPNSELISNPVTNFMFRDSFWRVTCHVGVAYGSDTALVKQTLLEVASKHPDVLQDDQNKPVVLFKQFADSNLSFELWCIIKDVNKKYHIESDLNYAIDAAFRENHIVIAFPQRDLHIKEIIQPDKDKSE